MRIAFVGLSLYIGSFLVPALAAPFPANLDASTEHWLAPRDGPAPGGSPGAHPLMQAQSYPPARPDYPSYPPARPNYPSYPPPGPYRTQYVQSSNSNDDGIIVATALGATTAGAGIALGAKAIYDHVHVKEVFKDGATTKDVEDKFTQEGLREPFNKWSEKIKLNKHVVDGSYNAEGRKLVNGFLHDAAKVMKIE